MSDGHDNATASMMRESTWNIPVQFHEIEKSQQGVTRNKGVQLATSDRCLFLGDDMFLEKGACEKHLGENAILGFITWDTALEITPAMKFLDESGGQFGYPMIAKYAGQPIPRSLQHRFTSTGNISLPTSVAKRIPFREDLLMYGWEDMEWGERLAKEGVVLMYIPEAKALHHHHITLEQSLKRMETIGTSLMVISEKLPEFERAPSVLKMIYYKVESLLPTMRGKHRRAFLKGIKNHSSS